MRPRGGEPGGRHCNAPSNGGGSRAPPELALCGAAASGPWSSGSGVNCPHPSPDFGTRPHSPPLLPTGPQHLVPLSAWEVTPRGKKKKKKIEVFGLPGDDWWVSS